MYTYRAGDYPHPLAAGRVPVLRGLLHSMDTKRAREPFTLWPIPFPSPKQQVPTCLGKHSTGPEASVEDRAGLAPAPPYFSTSQCGRSIALYGHPVQTG